MYGAIRYFALINVAFACVGAFAGGWVEGWGPETKDGVLFKQSPIASADVTVEKAGYATVNIIATNGYWCQIQASREEAGSLLVSIRSGANVICNGHLTQKAGTTKQGIKTTYYSIGGELN